MSDKKRKVPKLRFPGFTDEWEQRKLGDLVDRVVRKNTNNECSLPLTISAQDGLVDQITYFNKRIASRDVSNYYLVMNGEFAYNKSTSDGFPFGAVKRLDLYEKGVLSTLYIVFGIKNFKEVNSDFLAVFFDTDRWYKGVAERAAEGARNHGLLNISVEDFFDIDICIPKQESEQSIIGEYMNRLDNLITLHQRKSENLQKLKKGLLQKMFPKNKECVPELRFPGFTDTWEQRKVGDLPSNIYGGGTPTTSNEGFWGGTIPWIQSSDLTANQVFGVHPRKYITKAAVMNSATKIVPENSLAIITRVGVGKLAIMPFSYTTSQDFLSLSELKTDVQFTAYLLYKRLQGELNSVQGTSIKGITKDELLKKIIYVPERREQEELGAFFRNLDNLITLHQRKLEHLEDLKKGLLQQMFI